MLIPKTLYIKNFLSFKEEMIEINNGITTCVMGRNLSDTGQLSNGSGKSAIQSAFELAYTGGVSRKVTKDKLVRRGCKEAIVIHEVFNNIKNETLRIERCLPVKGSEKVEIFLYKDFNEFDENPDDFKIDLATTPDANNWIINYIGISKEDISNYFIPNEVSYTSFFNSSDTKKKELISRFSNANIIDSVFDGVDVDIKEFDNKIWDKEKELLKVESKIETRQEDLQKEIDKDFEFEKSIKLEKINKTIKTNNGLIDEGKVKLTDFNGLITDLSENILNQRKKTLKSIKSYMETFKGSMKDFEMEYDKLNNKTDLLNTTEIKVNISKREVNEDLESVEADISKMNLILGGKIKCPKCKFEFNPQSEITVEDADKKLKEFEKELLEFQGDLVKVQEAQKVVKKEKEQIQNSGVILSKEQIASNNKERKINKIIRLVSESLELILNKIKGYQREIKEINEEDIFYKEQNQKLLKRLKEVTDSEKDFTHENELKGEIKSLEKESLKISAEISDLTEHQNKVKEWEVNFKLFKSYLANKKLKIIQDIINKYLDEMKSDFKLKLEGYKQLKNGEIREKITPYIYDNGDICNYGEFSKGERVRIDYATILTLQTLVNENCEKGGLDFCFPDEIGEGLDSLGLKNLLESLNLTNKTSLLTTHVTNDDIYPHILMVEKVNKISTIKTN